MIHSAPSNKVKDIYLDQGRLPLLTAGLASTVILLIGNVLFTMAHPAFYPYALFVFILAFYLGISYFVGFSGRDFNVSRHQSLLTKWLDRSQDASVDIFLPVCREPVELIRNSWNYVRELASQHPNVKVHVLDDGASDELEGLAATFRFNYIRRDSNELKKAGNLRNAFAKTSGEFILILDADFCPRRDLLIELLPYLLEDKGTAIVQSPQYFGVYGWNTWVQKGAGAIQELFYRLIQVNRNTYNGSICVGTNAIYRRAALEPFGGTAPIPYSEDVHTGFQVIGQGWKIEYVPVNLAEGVCPETVQQFFTQQYRWAMGSISLFFSKKFWGTSLGIGQRLCYLSGMFYYIATGLTIAVGVLPSLLILTFLPEKLLWFNLMFSVPSLLFSTLFMWNWMKQPMSVHVLRARHISYFSHIFALKDYLMGTLEEWKPTGAQTTSERYRTFRKVFALHTILTNFGILALIAVRIGQGYEAHNFILLGAITLFNAYVALPVLRSLR